MAFELKLRKTGKSVGIILPKQALARLKACVGDSLLLTETPDGGFRLTTMIPEFARKVQVAKSLSRHYGNALKELAK